MLAVKIIWPCWRARWWNLQQKWVHLSFGLEVDRQKSFLRYHIILKLILSDKVMMFQMYELGSPLKLWNLCTFMLMAARRQSLEFSASGLVTGADDSRERCCATGLNNKGRSLVPRVPLLITHTYANEHKDLSDLIYFHFSWFCYHKCFIIMDYLHGYITFTNGTGVVWGKVERTNMK